MCSLNDYAMQNEHGAKSTHSGEHEITLNSESVTIACLCSVYYLHIENILSTVLRNC